MRRVTPTAVVAVTCAAAFALVIACSPTPEEQDTQRSLQSVGNLVTNQPAEPARYSPTREQINAWVRTWEQAPGKLAYVYIYNQGVAAPIGYYVLKGPPVSYSAALTQPVNSQSVNNGAIAVPNPAQDGAYYPPGAGGSSQYYGIDASSGQMLEFGGTGVWYLLSDQPLRIQAPPLGPSQIPRSS